MGFLGKLAFWKKNEPDFGSDMGMPNTDFSAQNDLGLPKPDPTAFQGVGDPEGQRSMNQSLSQQMAPDPRSTGYSTFSQPPVQQQQQHNGADMEVVLAKLDALKASLDSINQRLQNIERIAYAEQQDSKYRW
ncbi:hypothetical protein GOV09_04340 [Candidatus Woesearchaeota archaeon]|nr:hypothetical protein [Candidatus Woesearchaeota archaeon]